MIRGSLVLIAAPLGWGWAACRRVLEQDTEPQIGPDVQLAPCMAVAAVKYKFNDLYVRIWCEKPMHFHQIWALIYVSTYNLQFH